MREFLYGLDGRLLAVALLIAFFVLTYLGWRHGCRSGRANDEVFRSHINTLLGSVLGLMGLMLGFTFSMALTRFDARSDALIEEANAIGTAALRARLLPAEVQDQVSALLAQHVQLRQAESYIALHDEDARAALVASSGKLLDELWHLGTVAAAIDNNPVTTGLFIQALNETIDAFGRRDSIIRRHVPELVVSLMFGSVLLTGLVLGYSCGVAGHRPSIITYIFGILVVFVNYIVIDIDRPRRGLIQVDHAMLDNLSPRPPAPQAFDTSRPELGPPR